MKKYLIVPILTASLVLAGTWATYTFSNVSTESQLKAILGNLQQIASASDQYFIKHETKSVTYRQLIEDGYFRELQPALGEDYQMAISSSQKWICIQIPNDYRSVCIRF